MGKCPAPRVCIYPRLSPCSPSTQAALPGGTEAGVPAGTTRLPGTDPPCRRQWDGRVIRSSLDLCWWVGKLGEYDCAPSMAGEDRAPGRQRLAAQGEAVVTGAGAGTSHRPLPPAVQRQPHPLTSLACAGSPASLLRGPCRSQQGRSLNLCLSEREGDALWAEDWGTYSTITFAANKYVVCRCVCALLKALNLKLSVKKQQQTTELEKWQTCWRKWHHILSKGCKIQKGLTSTTDRKKYLCS